jgi:hypothetical protein
MNIANRTLFLHQSRGTGNLPAPEICRERALSPASGGGLKAKSGEAGLPRISIVTPSFNQGNFLEETIRSVLDQNYPNLEYIVVDGGSTDGSVEIIRRYEERLAWWVSEPDGGQYDAINKGFAHATGEIMGWIVADLLTAQPQIEWLTSLFHLFWDEAGRVIRCEGHAGFSRELVLRGGTLPGCGWPAWSFIQQESTFWRRSLWERAGGRVNPAYSLAGDYDLWMRFAKLAQLYSAHAPLAGFRQHPRQQTARHMDEYLRQARQAFVRQGGRPPTISSGFWLKKAGKLLRYFQRRYAHVCRQQGFKNQGIFCGGKKRWILQSH